MELSPVEITHREFKKGFWGYSVQEVTEFLERVAGRMEELVSEKAAAEGEAEALKDDVAKYRNLEDTLQKTLILAQRTSEEIIASAKKEAELIVGQARMDEKKLREDYSSVRAMKEDFELQFQVLIETFLKRLKSKRDEGNGEGA